MAWMRNALGSRVTNVKVRPSGDRPPSGAHCSRDHTAGQPAISELLAWWEFSQWHLKPRHVGAPRPGLSLLLLCACLTCALRHL